MPSSEYVIAGIHNQSDDAGDNAVTQYLDQEATGSVSYTHLRAHET